MSTTETYNIRGGKLYRDIQQTTDRVTMYQEKKKALAHRAVLEARKLKTDDDLLENAAYLLKIDDWIGRM